MNKKINDQIYILGLVYSNGYDELCLKLNETSIDLNFIYYISLKRSNDLREQLNKLLLEDAVYSNLNELFNRNEFFGKIQSSFDKNDSNSNDDEFNFKFNLLVIASLLENLPIVTLLLDYGALIVPREPLQLHPIHIALYKQNNQMLRLFLEQIPIDLIKDKWLNTLVDDEELNPLEIAINYYSQNSNSISLLYQFGIDLNYTKLPALAYALDYSDVPYDLIKLLLSFGADPNCIHRRMNFQHNALIQAISISRLDLIELLIDYGADVNMIVDDLLCCCALQFIIEESNNIKNYLEICECLLKNGANPSFYGLSFSIKNGYTSESIRSMPVLDTIRRENIELLKLLIRYGANIQTFIKGTYSPLCTACYIGNIDIVNILLLNGVDPTATCLNSNTPLTIATSMNYISIVHTLLPFYKDTHYINKKDGNGDFALLYAAYNKNTFLVRLLIQSGANVNLSNNFNCTPLWYSVYFNDKKTLIELLPYVKTFETPSIGINYYSFQYPPENIYGISLKPVEVAYRRKHFDILYILKQVGASVKILNEKNFGSVDNDAALLEILRNPLSLKRLAINLVHNLNLKQKFLYQQLPKSLYDMVLFKVV